MSTEASRWLPHFYQGFVLGAPRTASDAPDSHEHHHWSVSVVARACWIQVSTLSLPRADGKIIAARVGDRTARVLALITKSKPAAERLGDRSASALLAARSLR